MRAHNHMTFILLGDVDFVTALYTLQSVLHFIEIHVGLSYFNYKLSPPVFRPLKCRIHPVNVMYNVCWYIHRQRVEGLMNH